MTAQESSDTGDDFMNMDSLPEVVTSFQHEVTFEPDTFKYPRPLNPDEDKLDPDIFFGSVITLTNTQRIAEENNSATFDITQRFWQV